MHVYRWILNSTGKQTQPQTNIHHMQADLVLCKHSLHALHMDTHTLPRLCESVDICICQGSYSSLFSAPSVSEGNQIIFTHKPAASLLQIKRHIHIHIHTPHSLDSRGSIWQLVQWFLKAQCAIQQKFASVDGH